MNPELVSITTSSNEVMLNEKVEKSTSTKKRGLIFAGLTLFALVLLVSVGFFSYKAGANNNNNVLNPKRRSLLLEDDDYYYNDDIYADDDDEQVDNYGDYDENYQEVDNYDNYNNDEDEDDDDEEEEEEEEDNYDNDYYYGDDDDYDDEEGDYDYDDYDDYDNYDDNYDDDEDDYDDMLTMGMGMMNMGMMNMGMGQNQVNRAGHHTNMNGMGMSGRHQHGVQARTTNQNQNNFYRTGMMNRNAAPMGAGMRNGMM